MELIRESLARHPERRALTRRGVAVTYRQLAELVERHRRGLARAGATPGTVLALRLDASADSVALLLAAMETGSILVPLDRRSHKSLNVGADLAQAEMVAEIRGLESRAVISTTGRSAAHPLYEELRRRRTPGLVLFTSGSGGLPKGAVHDLERLLAKFASSGKDLRTLLFFYPDHISGFDTLFYALSNGSEMVVPEDRGPESVCRVIESESVQVLPTSPSFLNLLLLANCHERFDLSSLVYITYGGEVMHERTLARLVEVFPRVRISQKYGSTEFGALRIAPESSTSLWFRIGDGGTKIRVVDGMLQVRSESTMLGYLNADDPFTEDGWLDTRDEVEQRGDLLRVLGRSSDAINVGGERVHPARVEGVILELDEVADASVFGEESIILGNVVCARVVPSEPLDRATLRRRVQRHCRARLPPHEVPVRVIPEVQLPLASSFKKERRPVRAT
jgi:acyl-coenzyme A synthetase/AMP-(fatty) acid ligase